MTEIVFDIETIGDIRDYSSLTITVVSICDVAFDKYKSFEEHELGDLWPILEKADRLIGYNSETFDIPILNRYYTGDLSVFPHLDLLKVIKESSGKRYKLDDIARATLQIGKSADGLIAQEWWVAGEKQKVKDYCEQDVKVTKEIYEFGRKNMMLYYPTITGEVQPIAVNFDPPTQDVYGVSQQASGINMTLPI
jgi:DEAD/DEAH box helicase domain-containing protein